MLPLWIVNFLVSLLEDGGMDININILWNGLICFLAEI